MTTPDHGLLLGLTDDDHPQYLKAADLGDLDAEYLRLDGFNEMAGAINMNNHSVIGMAEPVVGTDGAHMTYVDDGDAAVLVTAAGLYLPIAGVAAEATILETARTIDITGDITATAQPFDGSQNIAISAAVNNNSHDHTDSTINSLNASATTAGVFGHARIPVVGGGGSHYDNTLTGLGSTAATKASKAIARPTGWSTTLVIVGATIEWAAMGVPSQLNGRILVDGNASSTHQSGQTESGDNERNITMFHAHITSQSTIDIEIQAWYTTTAGGTGKFISFSYTFLRMS